MECGWDKCSRPVQARGLCCVHYKTAWRLIQAGNTTWGELERVGIASARQRREPALAVLERARNRRRRRPQA